MAKQLHREAVGNSSSDNQFHVVPKRSGPSRHGTSLGTQQSRFQHGRLPKHIPSREESAVSTAKKIHHLQQKEKSGDDIRLRPQTSRLEHHSKGNSSHTRSGSGSSTNSSKGHQSDHPSASSEVCGSTSHPHLGHSKHRNTNSNADGESGGSLKRLGGEKKEKTTSSTHRHEKLGKFGQDSDPVSSKKTQESISLARSSRGSEAVHDKNTSHSLSRGDAQQQRNKLEGSQPVENVPDQKLTHLELENTKPVLNDETQSTDIVASSSKDVKHMYLPERKDSGIGSSPPSIDTQNEQMSTKVSIEYLPSYGGTDMLVNNNAENETTNREKGDANKCELKEEDSRIIYSRDQLLSLRKIPLSLQRPDALDEVTITTLLPADMISSNSELAIQSAESQVETDGKRKHPTALTLIREHDVKQLPKVSLSPQRRSFHSGCSWKDLGSGEPSSETLSTLTKELGNTSSYFDVESPVPMSTKSNHSSSQHDPPLAQIPLQAPPLSHRYTPRVIDHVPIRDQELGRGEKKNWREKSRDDDWKSQSRRDSTYFHHGKEEEEPEWMEFGPNDRFELIELVGLDEHEKEREARQGPVDSPCPSDYPAESHVESENHPLPKAEDMPNDKTTLDDISSDGVKEEVLQTKEVFSKDSDFVLDGLDFSLGLSFCHELIKDDEEEKNARSEVKSPSQVSSALRKFLKIGQTGEDKPSSQEDTKQDEHRILGMNSRPVNALTLDEIHARENIQPAFEGESTFNKPRNEDLGAFNKLVAGLQSSIVLKHSKLPIPPEQPMSPVSRSDGLVSIPSSSATPLSGLKSPEPVPPSPLKTFETRLENDVDFNEDVITGSHPHYYPPSSQLSEQEVVPHPSPMLSENNSRNLSRLEHLEQMLERLDTSHQHLFRERGDHTVSVPPVMGYRGHMPAHPDPRMKAKLSYDPNPMSVYGMSRMTSQQVEQQRSMLSDREGVYGYRDGVPNDLRGNMMPVRPPSHQHIGAGSGRTSSNNWAIEMERRRVNELQQMERSRLMERGGMYEGMGYGGAQHHKMAKPNISLLPTAVMRQIHNSKPSQSLSDMTKTNSLTSNRMDQDLTSQPPLPPSSISNMYTDLDHNPPPRVPSYAYQSQGAMGNPMRSVPSHHPLPMRPPGVDPAASAMMYQRYSNMPSIPRGGMPSHYMY